MEQNLYLDIKPTPSKFHNNNPVIPGDVKRKRIPGTLKYEKERFYEIDFGNIDEDHYVVSSFGRMFSKVTGQEMTPTNRFIGYNTVQLRDKNGKSKRFIVARLVARAFLPKNEYDKMFNRLFIHHKNWKNLEDKYFNLEWRSALELKILSLIKNGGFTDKEMIVEYVCKLFEKGLPMKQVHEIFDGTISMKEIKEIKNKNIYCDISEKYKF